LGLTKKGGACRSFKRMWESREEKKGLVREDREREEKNRVDKGKKVPSGGEFHLQAVNWRGYISLRIVE